MKRNLPNRKSIRLKGFDYSNPGLYFLTLCTQHHDYLFGEIININAVSNDAGDMIQKWYFELENKFKNLKCHESVVMPNHFHCIIEILNKINDVTIFHIMDWFKTMTTNEYIREVKNNNWERFDKRLWQLRYWDHIIRNNNELSRIQQYIINNPQKWEKDKLNGGSGNMVMEKSPEYGNNIESWMV